MNPNSPFGSTASLALARQRLRSTKWGAIHDTVSNKQMKESTQTTGKK
jgi:hypothetical protein